MPRYTFGGDIHDLIARPDAGALGALKIAPGIAVQFYAAATGGSPVTDYLLDTGGNNLFNVPTSSVVTMATGYLPDFQGPDNLDVLFYDPDPTDADVRRVRLVARDSGTAGVPDATTTAKGVVRYATAAERAAGASTTTATTPADVRAELNSHINAVEPHTIYTEAIDALQFDMGNKATFPVGVDQMTGVSTAAQADSIAQRTTSGALEVSPAATDTQAATLKQARDLSAFVAGADVRDFELASTLTLSTSATTWTTIPTIVIPDGASGHKWECELAIKYQAEAASGFKIRHKGGSVAETNLLAASNPSFESTNLSAWAVSSNATFTRATTGGGFHGTAYGVLTATATGNPTVTSPFVPIGAATTFAAGVYAKLGAGTDRVVRIDLAFSADGVNGGGWILGNNLTTTSAWQRAMNGNTTAEVPNVVGATHARVRVVYLQPAIGDAVQLDAVQLETSSPVPAYGSTGGSGDSALSVVGGYQGLTLTTPTIDNYSRRVGYRTPAVTAPTDGAEFGGFGTTTDADLTVSLRFTVTGTGLTNQRIEFEAAPRSTATVAPKIVAAAATFARVL